MKRIMKLIQTTVKDLIIKILKILMTGLMNLQVTRRVDREALKSDFDHSAVFIKPSNHWLLASL